MTITWAKAVLAGAAVPALLTIGAVAGCAKSAPSPSASITASSSAASAASTPSALAASTGPAQSTAPVASRAAKPPPARIPAAATPAPACSPETSSGNCYRPGEFCRAADHGMSGIDGDGRAIVCKDNDGWRWEPA